jgi:hypothetical protein
LPAFVSALDNAIEKHDECAAAMSSSGLVFPFAASEREGHDTSNVPTPELSSVTWPEPSNSEPCQTVVAFRVVAMLHPHECR